MLYVLCSLQTNLYISFHHQSDVLLQQGTTFMELLLSSEIINAMDKSLKKVHLSSGQPDLTLYWSWPIDVLAGGMSELRLIGPNLVPVLVTRCLYWGYV